MNPEKNSRIPEFVAELLNIEVEKWNRSNLPMLFEVTPSDGN